jgi:phosphoribosylformylglycinamidine (FGAM) synthase-like amidotransferase family enzyme
MVPVVTGIVEETGAVIHPMPYPEGFHRERTSLTQEVRREGVDL